MEDSKVKEICKRLGHILADTFVLYVKTLNFHWNMTSPHFFMYHKLLQEQYEGLVESIDELAERIRMLHGTPPSSMREFLEIACMKESKADLKDTEMIKELVTSHEMMVTHCANAIKFCQDSGDEGTADQLIERMQDHDKQAWLLRSHLKS